jgi:hypothetical protein
VRARSKQEEVAMCRRIVPRLAAVWSCGAALGGCSGMSLLTQQVASYGESNAFAPAGYSETKVDDTHYQVQATGTEATPRQRVEKIARARAAQIGVEGKLKYFKVASVQHGVKCTKRQAGYKSQDALPASRPTVVLDVVYSKDWADSSFTDATAAFDALSKELASEIVDTDAKTLAVQEIRASCGQS